MFLILIAIAFTFLCTKFYSLAEKIDWCFEKIAATSFVLMGILSFFIFVIVDCIVFNLLPLAFALVAVDILSARTCSEPIN